MVKEIIEEVKAVEAQADQIIRQSEIQAQDIVAKAQADAADLKVAVTTSRRESLREAQETDRILAEELLAAAAEKAQTEILELRKQSADREAEAISGIIQYFS